MEDTQISSLQSVKHDSDEINLLEYLYVLIKNKWFIIGLTVLGLISGYITALIKGPVYVADAVIAPREAETVKMPDLSGLGMFGGMVASQMNIGGNANLEKIELILNSRKFNAELVEKRDLVPMVYPEQWDTVNNKWIGQTEQPAHVSTGSYIKSKFLKKEIDKNGTMNIRVEHEDSLFSYTLLLAYLEYLDTFIKNDVQVDAKENRDYLENQLLGITDPLLRAKIQELIAKEVEKMMVVSKEAFKIIDPIYTYKSFKEKKLFPLLFALGLFFIVVLFFIFQHAFFHGEKSVEDKNLLQEIKKEIWALPFKKK